MFSTTNAKGIPISTNVDHLGVTVPYLQQAVVFFTEVLGAEFLFALKRVPAQNNPADLNKTFGLPNDRS